MTPPPEAADRKRGSMLEEFARVGRDHSDATVLYHATMASLLGLHPTDYKALGMLLRRGPMSAGDIARVSGLARSSVTNLIDRLEEKGFARRVRDTADRRRVLVEPVADRIGPAGKRVDSARRSLARLIERYTDSELAVINDFLARNAQRLRDETVKLTRSGRGRSPS